MVHFIHYAGNAYLNKESNYKDPVGRAMQDGFMQERFDPVQSQYSYEDLPSDKFGAIFGGEVFDPNSAKTISEQVKDYINKELKLADPTTAPNWESVPDKEPGKGESKKPPTATNKTTTPMYTPEPDSTPAPTEKKENPKPTK